MLNFSKLCMKPDEVDTVLYHGNCNDGFGSAFACYYYMKNKFPHKAISYHPCYHNQCPPDVNGKNVLICDISFSYDTMINMIKKSNKLCILDHHKTAQEDLKNIPDANKIFEMKHSGAYITWAYFFGESDVPKLIRYIEDNDIWTRTLPNTKAFTAFINSIQKKFDLYENFLDDNYIETTAIPVGLGMQRANEKYVEEAVKRTALNFMLINNKLYFVGSVNTSILKSEIGNAIFDSYPNADFSLCYSESTYTDENYVSLRSVNNATDVSAIAKLFNGGGHRNASGIVTYGSAYMPCVILDHYQCYNLLDQIKIKAQVLMDKETNVNIVYLNSTHHKKKIGQYLLQTKYIEQYNDKEREITQACSIMRNKTKDMSYYIGIDIACVYYYNESDESTYFTIVSDNADLLEHIGELYSDFIVDKNKQIRLKIAGFVNRLP